MKGIKLDIRRRSVEIGFANGAGGGNRSLARRSILQGNFLEVPRSWEFRPQKEDHGFTVQEVETIIQQL